MTTTTLTITERKLLDRMLSCDIDDAELRAQDPVKHSIMADLEHRGLVFTYQLQANRRRTAWTLSSTGFILARNYDKRRKERYDRLCEVARWNDSEDDVACAYMAYEMYHSSNNEPVENWDNLPDHIQNVWLLVVKSVKSFYAPLTVVIPPYDATPTTDGDA